MMNIYRFLPVVIASGISLLIAGCGDSAPLATKMVVSMTQNSNHSVTGRAPEIIVSQFFAAVEKADFQRAVTYCDGDMKLFMEACIASQKMQSPAENGFWDKEFRNFSKIRFDKIEFVSSETVLDNANTEYRLLTYKRAPYQEVLLGNSRPRVFELAAMLFPPKLTCSDEEKQNVITSVQKDFAVVDNPECIFQVACAKDTNGDFKIVNISLVQTENPEEEKMEEKADDEFNQEFMKLTEETEKEEKKPAPAQQEDQGMAGDDFGFGEL